MNSHEIERIADALHHLRPDWPVKQLRTLLASPQLASRPRRDVTVALAWVACETASASPYRVLESGPWWRAAGIEGTAQRREVLTADQRCGICSERKARCRQLWTNDHEFAPDFKTGTDADTAARIKDALKQEVKPMRERTPTPAPSASPEVAVRAAAGEGAA